ncbi:hypothetical protein Pla123a_37400 [Posidoniimonas polymericola]|uniref:PIN domain-containing protein n=1 Tax=Posidoniimonas polymericola TaxID=2528002 RepID=A0A5C5YDP2_9BACT|nr:PIN domain-containing protein [Posidoniimonas polymericola]TWT73846.1 hypothetical protein Pla123a_37400 [Posidoniimonas polymericola]
MAKTLTLIDTGPLVALFHERDQHHAGIKLVFARLQLPFLTCLPVITEAAYHLRNQPGKVQRLLEAARGTHLLLHPLGGADLQAVSEILHRYEDQRFDFADACLMHVAGANAGIEVFTVDTTDFSLYRTPDGSPLPLVDLGGSRGY